MCIIHIGLNFFLKTHLDHFHFLSKNNLHTLKHTNTHLKVNLLVQNIVCFLHSSCFMRVIGFYPYGHIQIIYLHVTEHHHKTLTYSK